jgi:uncharacterized lipoprotein YddW (UPF0748 family)
LITLKVDRALAKAFALNPAIPKVAELVAVAIPVLDNYVVVGVQLSVFLQRNLAI